VTDGAAYVSAASRVEVMAAAPATTGMP